MAAKRKQAPREPESPLKRQIRYREIRIRQQYEIDLVQFTRRFEWENLPVNLTDYKLEEMLYYRFTLGGIKGGLNQQVLPYAWVRQPDCYGNWNRTKPFMYNGTDNSPDNESETQPAPFLLTNGKSKIVVKDFKAKYPTAAEATVILWEHSPLAVNSYSTRHELVEPTIVSLVELLEMIEVANFKSTGIDIVDCANPDERMTTIFGLMGMKNDVLLSGTPWVVTNQNINKNAFQTGTFTHDLWKQYEAKNNYRLYTMGIEATGGDQADYKSIPEIEKQATGGSLLLIDAYEHRRRWAKLMNAVFGTDIRVKIRSVDRGGSISVSQAQKVEKVVKEKEEAAGAAETGGVGE